MTPRGVISMQIFMGNNFVELHFPEENHLGGQRDDFFCQKTPQIRKIQEYLREIRQKGQSQEGERPQEDDLEELENNVKPWLEKLQRIQEYLRKIRQDRLQHHGENEEVELEEIRSNVKPWLEKLQQIQEHLREFRQNGQPEEVEDGHPRPYLIGRRPPVGRTRAPRVARAAAMHRTKHPMIFPDNDDRVM